MKMLCRAPLLTVALVLVIFLSVPGVNSHDVPRSYDPITYCKVCKTIVRMLEPRIGPNGLLPRLEGKSRHIEKQVLLGHIAEEIDFVCKFGEFHEYNYKRACHNIMEEHDEDLQSWYNRRGLVSFNSREKEVMLYEEGNYTQFETEWCENVMDMCPEGHGDLNDPLYSEELPDPVENDKLVIPKLVLFSWDSEIISRFDRDNIVVIIRAASEEERDMSVALMRKMNQLARDIGRQMGMKFWFIDATRNDMQAYFKDYDMPAVFVAAASDRKERYMGFAPTKRGQASLQKIGKALEDMVAMDSSSMVIKRARLAIKGREKAEKEKGAKAAENSKDEV